jgi:hypothetical protein
MGILVSANAMQVVKFIRRRLETQTEPSQNTNKGQGNRAH